MLLVNVNSCHMSSACFHHPDCPLTLFCRSQNHRKWPFKNLLVSYMIFFFKFWHFHPPLWMQLRKIAHKNSKIETQPHPHSPLPFSVFFFYLSLSSHPFFLPMCQCMIQVRQLPSSYSYLTSPLRPPPLPPPPLPPLMDSQPLSGGRAGHRRITCSPFTHIPRRRNVPLRFKVTASQSGLTVEIKDEGRSRWFRHVAVVVVVRAPIPWFSAVSEASQMSDSKKENKDIPALCFFHCFASQMTVPKATGWPLIWYLKKEEIDAFEGPHWDCTKVILKQEELPRVRHFLDQCCLIKLIKIDAILWEHVPTGGGRVINHRAAIGFFITHLCRRFRVASSPSYLCPPLIISNSPLPI